MKLDPEALRRKVGQYADRWYIDPLPACDIAPATDEAWPSVSTLKKAASKDWTQVSAGRMAQWIKQEQPEFGPDSWQEVQNRLLAASSGGLDLASARGTQIHSMFEAYADGQDPALVELQAEAMNYRRTVLRCIAEMKPDIMLSEIVVINRTIGYAGTFDAIWKINGGLWGVDYKSRANKHAAYIEEAWQVTGYAHAEYGINADIDGNMYRFELPKLDGGLIVSITPASYQLIPIDLEAAWPGFQCLRDSWAHKANGKKGIFGKVWDNPKPTRDHWIRNRIETIKEIDIGPLLERWPEGVAKPKHSPPYTDREIDLIIPAVIYAETQVHAPWPENDPNPPVGEAGPEQVELSAGTEITPAPALPDEGDEMLKALEVVRYRYDQLSLLGHAWIEKMTKEALEAGFPIRCAEHPTARRIFIARALILVIEKRLSETIVIACLETATDRPTDPTLPLGHRIGLLSWEQAATFAALMSVAHSDQSAQPLAETPVAPVEQPNPTKPRKSRAKK